MTAAYTILIIALAAHQIGQYAPHIGTCRIVQVFTHYITAVGQAIGMTR